MVPLARTAPSQASNSSRGKTAGTSQVVIQTRAALGWGGMASATGDVAGAEEGGEDDMAGIPEAGRGGRGPGGAAHRQAGRAYWGLKPVTMKLL